MDQEPLKDLQESQNYFAQQKAESSLERTMPKLPNIVYKCLFTFKGRYAKEMDTLHWYESWFINTNLRSILLYLFLFFIRVFFVADHLKM